MSAVFLELVSVHAVLSVLVREGSALPALPLCALQAGGFCNFLFMRVEIVPLVLGVFGEERLLC